MSKISLILLVLLLSPIALANSQNGIISYLTNSTVDIKGLCQINGTLPCTSCNLTSFYPNMTIFINNSPMTNLPGAGNYFNYSLQSSIAGDYNTYMVCTYAGQTQAADASYRLEVSFSMTWEIAVMFFLSFLTGIFLWLMVSIDSKDWVLGLLYLSLGLGTSLIGTNFLYQIVLANLPSAVETIGILISGLLAAYLLIGGYIFINILKNVTQGKKDKFFQGTY